MMRATAVCVSGNEATRLSRNDAVQVVCELKTPDRDGTTHVLFYPLAFFGEARCRGTPAACTLGAIPR